ncbi:MAG: YqgE/AlgH family protein [Dehalococcoidia bacterium]
MDPNFSRTVVLVLLHDEGGAFGLILNRPTLVPIAEHLPYWVEHVATPARFFEGGPVQKESAIGLAQGEGVGTPDGWSPMPLGLGLVDLERQPDDVPAVIERVRLFVGYAGWSPGQLDGELQQGGWFVVPCEAGDVFTDRPAVLWREVLLRQPGKLAMFAYVPTDPRVN